MQLAKDLLDRGETATVLEYLQLCGQFWIANRGKLAEWIVLIRAGINPDFGPNLRINSNAASNMPDDRRLTRGPRCNAWFTNPSLRNSLSGQNFGLVRFSWRAWRLCVRLFFLGLDLTENDRLPD